MDDVERRRTILKATERFRMVVSTVDNFVATNAERSYKAAEVYTKAKVVKKILANKVCILSDPFTSI
jgi:predicted house-cleaning NTP pyrophosphatase (Maf/HAM1 superfamily)